MTFQRSAPGHASHRELLRPRLHRLTARTLATAAFVLSIGAAEYGSAADSRSQPNIVLILADDLGWRDTTVYGSTFYRTPNIARLAARGMTFANAYSASPLCSPTRASILTGQYPGRLRFTTPAGHLKEEVLDPQMPERGPPQHKAVTPPTRTRLPNEYVTIAELLKEAGFTNGFLGKWHLGWPPYMPENQGFDHVVGGRHHPGPPSYFSPYRIETIPDGPPDEHITDRLTEEAIRFLHQNQDRPFFLNFWHYSVHAPYQAKTPVVEEYRQRVQAEDPQRNPVMGSMIQSLDESVGRVLDTLDELRLADKTLILFTSDNGGNMYDRVAEAGGLTPTNNAPLRNGKGNIYEGGHRVPLIVVWPGVVQPASRSEAIVTSVDYFPTLVEIFGLQPPAAQVVDGVSIVRALKQQGDLEREAIFCHFPHYIPATGNLPATSVRKGDWKLIRFYADGPEQADRFELYNLKEDIGETRDLAETMPDRVQELADLIERHLEETAPLVPVANPDYRPTAAGWNGNQHARLELNEGRLLVQATGGDPFLTTAEVPRVAGPVTLRMRMKSNSRADGRVYWSTATERGFARERSVEFPTQHDGQWHDYQIELPLPSRLTSLRIDPSQAPGRIEIDRLELWDGGGLAKRWVGAEE